MSRSVLKTLNKWLLTCLFAFCVFLMADGTEAQAKTFTDNKDGTIAFSYNNKKGNKMKVVIQVKGGKMYQYDIPKGKNKMVFPLSSGNGTYKIYLCKNTTGSKYSIVESVSIDLELEDDTIPFMGSNYIVNWDTTNEAIKKAAELTKDLNDDREKIEVLHGYIVENFSYDYEKMTNVDSLSENGAYVPNIEDTFASQTGICYDISVMLASMLRSVDIPAKVVTGYTPNASTYHAWNNVYYVPKTSWKTVDATYDIQMHAIGKQYDIFKDDKDYANIVYRY